MLPAGHSNGIAYTAEPTAPAFYATRNEFYSLNLDTGVFGAAHLLAATNPQRSTATYTSSLNGNDEYPHFSYAPPRSIKSYSLSNSNLVTNSAESALDLFGQGGSTIYLLTLNSEIFSYSWNGTTLGTANVLYTSQANLERLYIQDNIAIGLTQTSGQYGIERIDLTTGTLIDSFAMTGTFANSLTLDSEGNIYVGNNQGGAYVYDATGQLLTSFVPGAVNPADPNLGTNSAWMFLNTAGDLLVMDNTGLHQYAVVPEPGTWTLICLGAGVLVGLQRRSFLSRQG